MVVINNNRLREELLQSNLMVHPVPNQKKNVVKEKYKPSKPKMENFQILLDDEINKLKNGEH